MSTTLEPSLSSYRGDGMPERWRRPEVAESEDFLGPWDAQDVEIDHSRMLDLGSIIVEPFEGARAELVFDQNTGVATSLLLRQHDSAIQITAVASPRTSGLWDELRPEVIEAAKHLGGDAKAVDGPFGEATELRRMMQKGDGMLEPTRTWVADRSRWMLVGTLYGPAAWSEGTDGYADKLYQAFRNTVVRRGEAGMGPGTVLPLSPDGTAPTNVRQVELLDVLYPDIA